MCDSLQQKEGPSQRRFQNWEATWEDKGAPITFVCYTSSLSPKDMTGEGIRADGPI